MSRTQYGLKALFFAMLWVAVGVSGRHSQLNALFWAVTVAWFSLWCAAFAEAQWSVAVTIAVSFAVAAYFLLSIAAKIVSDVSGNGADVGDSGLAAHIVSVASVAGAVSLPIAVVARDFLAKRS